MLGKDNAIKESTIRSLSSVIRSKKELKSLQEEFVRGQIYGYVQQHPKAAAFLSTSANPRSEKYQKIVKDIRASLRKIYGVFRTEQQGAIRAELVERLATEPAHLQTVAKEILDTHSSTRERLPFYEEFYQKIFAITGKPAAILDLGCGLNPFSIPLMKLEKLTYHAYDLNEEEVALLNRFFARLHRISPQFSGKAAILDLVQWARLTALKKVEVCFLFKMTEVLDQGKGHKTTEQVMRAVPARFVAVSFPTRTLSGRKMNVPRRNWVEWMCNRLGYPFKILEFPTEIVYVVRKG